MTGEYVPVTAKTNFVIDTNNSRRIGNVIVVSVKGHATGALSSGGMFGLDFTGTIRNGSNTFPIGIGSEWNITSVGYGYFNSQSKNFSTQTLTSGQYVHLQYVVVIN